MSGFLQPNRVRVKDIPIWIRESWSLFWRRPVLFTVASIIFHFIAYQLKFIGSISILIAILICYLLLLVLIQFAESTDRSKAIKIEPVYHMMRRVILSLLLLTLIYTALYLVAAVLTVWLAFDLPQANSVGAQLALVIEWVWPGKLAFMILMMGVIATSMWFMPPLISLHDIGMREARALAKRAEAINPKVVFVASFVPFAAVIVLSMITKLSYLLNLILVPLFAIYFYVSYRHVFLGKRENQPVPGKTHEASFNPAAVER